MAVASGIGAAVLAGAGVAAADDAGSDSPSSAKSSASTETSSANTSSAKTSSARTESDKVDDKADSGEDGVAADDAADEDVVERKRNRVRKVPLEKSARKIAAEDQPDEPDKPGVDVEPVAAVAEPVTEQAPAKVRHQVASTVISNVVSAIFHVDRRDEPADPGQSAVALTLIATARKADEEPIAEPAGPQVATSLVAAGAAPYPVPTGVDVIPWTPLLEWLQKVPVLGRFVVTPTVRLLHVIPFVGDFLHPIIGFPIDHAAPPGAPQARSFIVKSFDGTKIFVNFMPAQGLDGDDEAPTILSGSGLGLPGATTLDLVNDSFLPHDVIGIGALREEGYNVVTWDPRGEWRSGGRMQLQSPEFEGRDVSYIISYLATLPGVELDGANDPKLGMVGASYGGGIQLATAAIDHRIDAIVPTIAWNSLTDVLFPRGAVRSGWATILSAALVLTLSRPNEQILPAAIKGILFGQVSQDDIDLLNNRGYADQLGDITTPTLLVQGTVDTLFTLAQADTNARALIAAGTTTKVLWYCGGHGACLSSYNNGDVIDDRTLAWLDHYVKGEDVPTGKQFEWVDQNGDLYSSDSYPAPQGMTSVEAESTVPKTIPFVPFIGGSGPNPLIITRGLIPALLGLPSAAPALNAVNLEVPAATETTHIIGAPELTLTYSGIGNARNVYAQIVDDTTHLVLGNLATPIPVDLDGQTHTVTYSLEQVAQTLEPGQSVTVQIVTSTFDFLNFYSSGTITVEGMSVKLPTLGAAAVALVAAA